MELREQGYSIREIARCLEVAIGTVHGDLRALYRYSGRDPKSVHESVHESVQVSPEIERDNVVPFRNPAVRY
jgi:hypothetical protein